MIPAVAKKYEVSIHHNAKFETEKNSCDEVFLASFVFLTGLSNCILNLKY